MRSPSGKRLRRAQTEYPYSLDRQTEYVFLQELAGVLDIALWRAAEIEECVAEIRKLGAVADRPLRYGRGGRSVSGRTRLYGSIEALLAAWARASLLLHPTQGNKARGRHLRSVLRLRTPSLVADTEDRRLRDGWMHLDEDLDKWAKLREGAVGVSTVSGEGESWHEVVFRGAIRVVDPNHLGVTLPRRGQWSLFPYIHRCQDLRERVQVALDDADVRWHCVDGVCGIIVGWAGLGREPPLWMIRALNLPEPFTVSAPSIPELEHAFAAAVTKSRAGPR